MKGFIFLAGFGVLLIGVLVLASGIACATMPARPDDVLWSKTFAGNGSHNCLAIACTTGGGYVLGGQSVNGTNASAYAAKTDGNGSLLWENNSFPGSVAFYDVISLPGGSLVFAGAYGGVSTNAAQQGFLAKTDADGRQIFARTYGIDGNLYLSRVLAEDDGSLVVLGMGINLSEGGTERSYVYLLKVDTAGNVLWSQLYGGLYGLNCQGFVKANDGGYAIAGSVTNISRGTIDACLIKVDRDGNKLWEARYSGTGYVTIASLCTAGDDGYLLGGQISNQPGTKRYVLRVGLNGTVLWNRTYAADDTVYDVLPASGGGFVLACGHNVTKVSSDGVEEWGRDFGKGDCALNCVVEAADGSYVFGGYTTTADRNLSLWLVDIGMTKAPGFTPEGCCWPAFVLPSVAVSVVALRRRRQS
ncbi:MAG TPA: hypothetical protein VGJ92_10560 [Methanocella sp.]|jgi:hypothetical protein